MNLPKNLAGDLWSGLAAARLALMAGIASVLASRRRRRNAELCAREA